MQDPLNTSYPVLPLRDIVVFPHMIVPLFVGRDKSVRALEEEMQDDKQILMSLRDIVVFPHMIVPLFEVGTYLCAPAKW